MATYLRIKTTCPELDASGFALVAFDRDDIERARKAFDGACATVRVAGLEVFELAVSANVSFFDDRCDSSEVRALIDSDSLDEPTLLELRPAWLGKCLHTESDALVVTGQGCYWTSVDHATDARIETDHLFSSALALLQGAA
jgi:hypothetical protein